MAKGESYDISFDVRIDHGRDERAKIALNSTPANGEYELALGTDSITEEKPIDDRSCDVGTRLRGAGELRNDLQTVRVTFDGTTLVQISNESTVPSLYTLPDPVTS